MTDYAVCEPVLESTYMSVFECVLFGLRLLKGGLSVNITVQIVVSVCVSVGVWVCRRECECELRMCLCTRLRTLFVGVCGVWRWL